MEKYCIMICIKNQYEMKKQEKENEKIKEEVIKIIEKVKCKYDIEISEIKKFIYSVKRHRTGCFMYLRIELEENANYNFKELKEYIMSESNILKYMIINETNN